MSAPRTRPRTGGLRIGLVLCTVVVLTAACGSIDVVTGDAGGSGGAPGGGSGGTPGGGNGGMHAGGSGGSAGAHGSGGALGSGGTIGGGTGGTNRGSGGSNGGGTGGTQGSGGGSGADAGAGGAGGSGPSCTSLQKAFTIALANAKSCVVGATGYCGVTTLDKLDCGCPTHVNDTKDIDSIRTQWAQSGCSSGVCTNVLCVAYKSATCTVPSGAMAAVCTDLATPPTP